jgi:hypothetical protein
MGDLLLKADTPNPPWPEARALRLETDGHRCQAHTYGITTVCEDWPSPVEVHHRLPRGRGGRNDQDNLITLCSGHHRWAESHRADAYACGLLLASRTEPTAPVTASRLLDTHIRTLFCVLNLWRHYGRVTVDQVADTRGMAKSTAHAHLVRLAAFGLVGYETGRRGVLRPLVERVA